MAKDYGRRKPGKQKSSAPKQFFWILASFLGGYLAATVFDFTSLSTWVNNNILTKEEQKPETKQLARRPELPKPKFEFYTLLAKDQTVVARPTPAKPTPRTAAAAVASAPAAVQKPQPAAAVPVVESKPAVSVANAATAKGSYQIQVASFRNRQDAEHLKAALTLKGFDVNVYNTSQNNVNWFRVIVGPFDSRIDAEKMQLTLARNEHIHGMIRKMNA